VPLEGAGDLERLAQQSPDAAATLRTTPPACEWVAARSGGVVLAESGVTWGSRYAPEREARRFAARVAAQAPDVIVLLGFETGYRVEALLEQTEARIVVYESDPKRLRSALEARAGLGWLADPRLRFALSPEQLGAAFEDVYQAGLRVCSEVHPVLQQLDGEAVARALRVVAQAKTACDLAAQTRVRASHGWLAQTVDHLGSCLDAPDAAVLAGVFAGRPAVMAAAGPSLDRALPLLREWSDRVVIVAIGQSLGALRAAGIEPHLTHIAESQDVRHQLTRCGDPSQLDLVLLPSSHAGLFEVPVRSRFVAHPVTNPLSGWLRAALDPERGWSPIGGGSSVALSAVSLAASLGCDPIVLVGQDLAFTDDRAYARNSAYDMVALERDEAGALVFSNVRAKSGLFGIDSVDRADADAVAVEAWDGGTVMTSRSYLTFIEQYAKLGGALAARGQRVVNCTGGGARIAGLAHEPLAACLEREAGEAFDARARIRAAHDAAAAPDEARLERAVARALRDAAAVRHDAERGIARVRKLQRTPASVDARALSRIHELEVRMQRRLEALPWFDDLVRGALHDNDLALRRAGGRELELEETLGLSLRLFVTMRDAAREGGQLLARIAGTLEQRAALASVEASGSASATRAD